MSLNAASQPQSDQHVRLCIGRLTVRTKTWLEIDGRFVVGEHGVELLRQVDDTGSLAAAARACGWSYRHAWGYIKNAEAVLGESLITVHPGRGKGRGAVLTTLGREILAYATQVAKPDPRLSDLVVNG
jgi:molybdate transport system regulatory protein